MLSIVSPRVPLAVNAPPVATTIVPIPWPWMRSEIGAVGVHRLRDRVDPGLEADGAAALRLHLVDRGLDRERAGGVRLGRDADGAVAALAVAAERRPLPAAVALRAGERDRAEPRVVVVHAERRRGVELLDRRVRRARGEDPVVAGAEAAAAAGRDRERDDDRRSRACTCADPVVGTVIDPVAPGASRSTICVPAPSFTEPDWSQRRTRRWRAAASVALAGCRSAGSAPVNEIVRAASSTVTLRSTPGFWFSS